MNTDTRLGIGVLLAAVALGVLGDALLRATPWGLNAVLGTAALVVTQLMLLRRHQRGLQGEGRWLLVPILFFAAGMAWRDSPTLKALDGLALLIALALLAIRGRTGRLRVAGIVDYVVWLLVAGLTVVFGPFLLVLSDIRWHEIPRDGWQRRALAVGRGLLLALPLLFVFGALFVSADAGFEHLLLNTFQFDFDSMIAHGLVIGSCAWTAGGWLRGALLREDPIEVPGSRAQLLSLGTIEIGTVLGLLDLLFLAFIVTQLPYLFGGVAWVGSPIWGTTFADYARRGFFELVTATAMALPILLLAHWLLRKECPQSERLFRLLGGLQVVLLFVIMASALQRMRLYQSEYGLTELRLYTTAFMGWLAVVLLWFPATVLRGQRERFAFGALAAAFLSIAVLHAINPDALIVRANVRNIRAGHAFDADYATSLSADAVPALIAALPSLPPPDRQAIAKRLTQESTAESADWRTWSLARALASRAIQANRARLSPEGVH